MTDEEKGRWVEAYNRQQQLESAEAWKRFFERKWGAGWDGRIIRYTSLPAPKSSPIEVESGTYMSRFPHGPLSTEALCDEWIATTLRKLPRGALYRLYRILHDGESIRRDACASEEAKWKRSL